MKVGLTYMCYMLIIILHVLLVAMVSTAAAADDNYNNMWGETSADVSGARDDALRAIVRHHLNKRSW